MAVGIGLVFGVLRLVNFAYGQLIMAGAYALAFASQWDWPRWARDPLLLRASCSRSRSLMDRLVFRPLRTQSPAVMLVATFAVAFLLQSIALLAFGPLGKIAVVARAAQPAGDDLAASTSARSRSSRSSSRSSASLLAPAAARRARRSGLHMRAASMDFRHRAPARRAREPRDRRRRARLGRARGGRRGDAHRAEPARARRTSRSATRSSCSPASCSAGSNRPIPATLGGFAIGFASGLLGGALPTNAEPVPAVVPLRAR